MPELIICCIRMIYHSKLFSVGLLNLFRLKTQRNKRSEPYYHPFVMKSVERGKSYDPVLRNTTRYIYQVFREIAKQRNRDTAEYRDTRIKGYIHTERQGYRDTGIHLYIDTLLHCYRNTWIQGYRDTVMQRYRNIGIQIQRDTEIHGYMDKGIQGFRDI